MQDFHDTPQGDPVYTPPAESRETPYSAPPAGWQPAPVQSRRGRRAIWILLAVIAGALLLSIIAVQAAYYKKRVAAASLPYPSGSGSFSAPSPTELSNSFREVARTVKPAVVNINIVERVPQGSSLLPFDFPGDDSGPQKERGTGSGVVVTADGYILTNNHVVGKADQIEVTLADGRKFKGKRVGTDPETDLAVVKIDASGLPTAMLGNSDDVEQGDWVLALGSPFGLQQTLTAGIVSATGRDLPNASPFSHYIQTDASINPGNSGGPLVNMRGEVVGINTFIFTRSGGNEGIGFAIPSNLARKVYSDLVKSGKVTRGYLGVQIVSLDAAKAQALNVSADSGVLVADVPDNSPAARAGIRSGDVILAFDGKPVKSPAELTQAVASTPVGQSVRVDFVRDGQKQSVNVVLDERPADLNARNTQPDDGGQGDDEEARPAKLGLSVQTVTPDVARQLRLRVSSGAMVVSVSSGGPAGDAGLRHGDVIHQIGRTRVNNADDVVQASKNLKSGDEVALQIERNGQMAFVTLSID